VAGQESNPASGISFFQIFSQIMSQPFTKLLILNELMSAADVSIYVFVLLFVISPQPGLVRM
jgi:hypothetical protein